MKANDVEVGMRVRVTCRPHKGKEGTVVWYKFEAPTKGAGYQNFCRARATIETDDGERILGQPRWMEPV